MAYIAWAWIYESSTRTIKLDPVSFSSIAKQQPQRIGENIGIVGVVVAK